MQKSIKSVTEYNASGINNIGNSTMNEQPKHINMDEVTNITNL
jgi:hypothetical protein